jgi:hypothetical protein
MTARKQTDRQKLINFVKWMNKERICGCVQLIPGSIVTTYFWAKLEADLRKINKNDLLEGGKF